MTNKEQIILAKIRNKYSPIFNYFKLRDEMINGVHSEEKKERLQVMLDDLVELSSDSAIEVAKLLKSFG